MSESKTPEYIEAFLRAVYPEYTALETAFNNEKSCLTDATNVINELRKQLAAAQAENAKLRELLDVAVCPNCDGSGFVVRESGGCDSDGENDTRECVQELCQWCAER